MKSFLKCTRPLNNSPANRHNANVFRIANNVRIFRLTRIYVRIYFKYIFRNIDAITVRVDDTTMSRYYEKKKLSSRVNRINDTYSTRWWIVSISITNVESVYWHLIRVQRVHVELYYVRQNEINYTFLIIPEFARYTKHRKQNFRKLLIVLIESFVVRFDR